MKTSASELGRLKWKTREGRTMRLDEMSPSHLRNAAAMLRRVAVEHVNDAWRFYCSISSDAAESAAEAVVADAERDRSRRLALADAMDEVAQFKLAKQAD